MRVIYDQTTGQILTFTKPEQDYVRVMRNWPNSASAEVDRIIDQKDLAKWRINVATSELEQYRTNEQLAQEAAIAKNRIKRNGLLTQSDWTQVTDNNLSEEQRAEWRVYRQALRDIDLADPVWPIAPSN